MKSLNVLGIVFLWIGFHSCAPSRKIATLKPEPDQAAPLVLDVEPSFVQLPVELALKDIEKQLNLTFSGVIFEDNNLQDDDLMIKVTKEAPIQFLQSDGKIKTILPLKAVGTIKYGFTKLGISFSDTRDFKLNGVITLVSQVRLENWKLKTETTLQSLDWKERPSVNIAGREVAITYLMNASLKMFKQKLESTIDQAIATSIDFKPQVMDALQALSKPILVNESLRTWFRVTPIELYATRAVIEKDFVSMGLGLKCQMETLIGAEPAAQFVPNKIQLKPVEKMPNQVKANIVAIASYQEASQLMQQNFQGEVFTDGSRKVTVQKVDLWHKQGKMIVALTVAGSLNATIYLSGFPQYNEQTKEIYFDQLNYVLDTKNVLHRSANWLAQGKILKKIQESCRFSIQSQLKEGQQKLLQYLNNYSPTQGVFDNGSAQDFKFLKIQLTNHALVAMLSVEGKVKVTINGM